MSITFNIQNPKNFFVPKKILTIQECLGVAGDLTTVYFDEYNHGDDMTFEKFLSQSLSDVQGLYLYQPEVSGRGFELGFTDGNYHVRVNTPATIADWEQALDFLKRLSAHLNAPIVSEHDEIFTTDTITDYNYMSDILFGLQSIKNTLIDNELQDLEIIGIMHPMSFNQTMIDEILADANSAKTFSDMLIANQNIDAYFANPLIAENDNGINAIYVVSEDVPTILPYKPVLGWGHEVEAEDIDHWLIMPYIDGNDELIEIDYHHFISQLATDEYQWIDATHILLTHGLDKNRLLQLAQ